MKTISNAFCLAVMLAAIPAFASSDLPLDGTFIDLGFQQKQFVPTEQLGIMLDEIQAMGMQIVIVAATRVKQGKCENAPVQWVDGLPDKLDVLLREAEHRHMQVYLGLTSSAETCDDFSIGDNAALVLKDTADTVKILNDRFGNYPALAGWYIPDEPWYLPAEEIPYYRDLVAAIRMVSQKPIGLAPYLVNMDHERSPDEIADLAKKFMDATGVDLEIWQDSVGAAATDLGWSDRKQTKGTVRDYFKAISKAIGPMHLWSDNELFGCCDFAHDDSTSYRPTMASRLVEQFLETPRPDVVSHRVAWIFGREMGAVDPGHFPEAARLKAAFKAQFGLGGRLIRPAHYRWMTAPLREHADNGRKLFDGKTGDSKSADDNRWIGFWGDAQVILDMGAAPAHAHDVDWIAGHFLRIADQNIQFPSGMTIESSDDLRQWKSLGTFTVQETAFDGDYVLSNLTPLGAHARYFRVSLQCSPSAKIFISELEIVKN